MFNWLTPSRTFRRPRGGTRRPTRCGVRTRSAEQIRELPLRHPAAPPRACATRPRFPLVPTAPAMLYLLARFAAATARFGAGVCGGPASRHLLGRAEAVSSELTEMILPPTAKRLPEADIRTKIGGVIFPH